MGYVYYLAPIVSGMTARRRTLRGKWTQDANGSSTMRFGRGKRALCAANGSRELHAAILGDPECLVLGTEQHLDFGLLPAGIGAAIEQRVGVPTDWLRAGTTLRELLYGLACHAMLPQRFEPVVFRNKADCDLRERMLCRDATLDTPWAKLGSFRDECLAAFADFHGYEPPCENLRLRDVLNLAARHHAGHAMYVGGVDMRPQDPTTLAFAAALVAGAKRNFTRREVFALAGMLAVLAPLRPLHAAYTDNRNELISDTFDTAISANWDNGWDEWGTLAWNTGGGAGTVTPSAGFVSSAMRRVSGNFTGDHYVTITANLGQTGTTLAALGRVQPTDVDASCYLGEWNNYSSDNWAIEEANSAAAVTTLGTPAAWAGAPVANGETLTLECEGTTLRVGSAEGGPDTQRFTTTDGTLGATFTSGGLLIYVDATPPADNGRISALAAGSIAAGGGGGGGLLLRRRRS